MSAEGAGVLVAVLCLAFYLLATLELLALIGAGEVLKSASERFVPESMRARGPARILGIGFYGLLAVAVQGLALYVLVDRQNELTLVSGFALLAQFLAAGSWTLWLLKLLARRRREMER